ncbi:MAG: hypothetical protein JXX14_11975 [Deltaproteobacteria bacterium]|nr:hypothetical protein [Deltaproteobacteria bacterium]
MTRKTEAEIEKLVSKGCYEEALGIDVDATRSAVARAHIRQLHHFTHSEKAREALNQARTALVAESLERKLQRLIKLELLEAARTIAASALEDHESAYNFYMLGYVLYRMARYAESARYLLRAFEMSDSPFHAIWLGYALERQGEMAAALERYLWAVKRRGNETEHRLAGSIYFHMGDMPNACVHLEKAMALGCRDEDVSEKVLLIRQKQRYARLVSRLKSILSIGKAQH